jgi:hypothetical protein
MRLLRSVVAAALAALLFAVPAAAQQLSLIGVGRAPAAAGGGFSLAWRDAQDVTIAGATQTSGAMAIGSASADRLVVVTIGCSAVTTGSLTGVTIGGITATGIVTESSGNARPVNAYFAAVPSGTTAVVVATFDASMNRCAFDTFSVTGTTQITYSVRSGANPTASTTANLQTTPSITVPAGGAALAMVRVGAAGSVAWSQSVGTGTKTSDRFSTTQEVSTYVSSQTGAVTFTADGADSTNYRALSIGFAP